MQKSLSAVQLWLSHGAEDCCCISPCTAIEMRLPSNYSLPAPKLCMQLASKWLRWMAFYFLVSSNELSPLPVIQPLCSEKKKAMLNVSRGRCQSTSSPFLCTGTACLPVIVDLGNRWILCWSQVSKHPCRQDSHALLFAPSTWRQPFWISVSNVLRNSLYIYVKFCLLLQ